ncbi:CHAT domain-containing protein [Actinomadura miaoliensis]|uniref:CHAT domain-containing protein n=1 Tax=Actinomadura miaoliensis TaxID=430685 RepID=A0ABP7WLS7_9ACTN
MSCGAEAEVVGGLRNLVVDMCAAESWRATVRLAERHPVLLTDAALDVLAELIEEAGPGDPTMRDVFAWHRDLLVRAREGDGDGLRVRLDRALLAYEIAKSGEGLTEDVGYVVDQLAEFVTTPREDWMGVIAERPLLLHHGMPQVIEELAAMQDDEETAERVRRFRPFLARCRESGAVRALAERAAREYLSAANDDERASLLQQRPELREPVADEVVRAVGRDGGLDPASLDAALDFRRRFAEESATGRILDLTTLEPLVRPGVQEAVDRLLDADGEEELLAVLNDHPVLLDEDAWSGFAHRIMSARSAGEDLTAVRAARRQSVARRAAVAGPRAAVDEAAASAEEDVAEVVAAFLNVADMGGAWALIEAQPPLAEPAVAELLETFGLSGGSHAALLRQCHTEGTAVVFASVGTLEEAVNALSESASQFAERFRSGGTPQKLAVAAVMAESVAALRGPSDPGMRAGAYGFAGELRFALYIETRDERHFQRAVRHFETALAGGAPYHRRAIDLFNFAVLLYQHAVAGGGGTDPLRRAVGLLEQVVDPASAAGDAPGLREMAVTQFGEVAAELARRTRSVEVIDDALDLTARLTAGPSGGGLADALRAAHGHLLEARWDLTRGQADLERLLEFRERGVRTDPRALGPRLELVTNLVAAIPEFSMDVGRAEAAIDEAVEAAGDDVESRGLLALLLADLVSKKARLGSASHGDALGAAYEAQRYHTRTDVDRHAYTLLLIGRAYRERYRADGDPTDLRRSMDALEEGAELEPSGQVRPALVLEWVDTLRLVYELTGDRATLRRAVALAEGNAGSDRVVRAHRLQQLAVLYSDRYVAEGDLGDLDRSIDSAQRALDLLVRHGFNWRAVAMSLASRLMLRARVTGEVRNADLAVSLLDEAAVGEGSGGGDERAADQRARRLTNLGNALLQRYMLVADGDDDLRRAVAVLREAPETTAESSPYWPRRVFNLANALQALGEARRDPAVLDEAVGAFRRALDRVGNSVFRAMYTVPMCSALLLKHRLTEDAAPREEAVRTLEDLLRTDPPWQGTVLGAQLLGNAHAAGGRWEQACAAYARCMEALTIAVRGERLRGNKEGWLREAVGVPTRAAVAHVHAGDPAQAVAVLERGRAVLLAQALELADADVAELRAAGRHDVADRWEAVTRRIAVLQAEEPDDVVPGRIDLSDRLAVAHRKLEDVLAEIRADPRHRDFPRPAPPDPDTAAPGAPVIYVTATAERGLALVSRGPDDVTPVWLPDLTEEESITRVSALLDVSHPDAAPDHGAAAALVDEIVHWLRATVFDVLAEHLPGTARVVLVPVGHLAQLPLHAAAAMTGITATYSPSALALRVATGRARTRGAERALAVADPAGTGLPPLAAARLEADLVAALFGDPDAALERESATRDEVRRRAADTDVLHLACHGLAAPFAPLDSGLVLTGGEMLTARDLSADRLVARLVMLTACASGVPGVRLPDEVVGLPTSLLHAGAAGVLATMWRVPDDGALLFSIAFYEAWRIQGKAPADAWAAAVEWLRTTTDGAKTEYFARLMADPQSWLPHPVAERCWELLVLRAPGGISHGTPYLWAPFSYHGA